MIRSPPTIFRGRALPFWQDVQSCGQTGRWAGVRLHEWRDHSRNRDLTKEFAGFVAVNGVNLKVERGTIHALIGPNGAGKTTCFNLLTKFLNPTRGQILYKGQRHHRAAAGRYRAARRRALVPDFGGVSAPDRAGKCPRRAAAQARRLVRFLALAQRARTNSTTAPYRSSTMSVCPASPMCRRSNCPMAASARSKSRPRSRSIRKCCCSTSRPPAWATRTSTASRP